MTNFERVKNANIEKLAKIIHDEISGMCRCCMFMYTNDCMYDKDIHIINPHACCKGIAEWLQSDVK